MTRREPMGVGDFGPYLTAQSPEEFARTVAGNLAQLAGILKDKNFRLIDIDNEEHQWWKDDIHAAIAFLTNNVKYMTVEELEAALNA